MHFSDKSIEKGFSILIPSWNNLPYLRLCIESIIKHGIYPHEIIVFLNEGSDGSRAYLDHLGIVYDFDKTNVGICSAMNRAARLATRDWLFYLNDDMVVLPGWDEELVKTLQTRKTDRLMLSSTMIEPRNTGNPCVIHHDFGGSPETFEEERLLKSFSQFPMADWSGSSWPPNLVHKNLWNEIGGFSEAFSPGMSSDNDYSMKLWKAGVRHFQGLGKSRVYHFQAVSTKRITKNNGRLQFLKKWGIAQSVFYQSYLRMGKPFVGPLNEPRGLEFVWGRFRSKIKLILAFFSPEE